MAAASTQLDYAHEPAALRRRFVWRRRVVSAAILLVVVLASVKWVGPAWRHARLVYWQGKCLAYEAGDKLVVAGGIGGDCAGPWREFYNLFSPPGRKALGTVFLHELRKPDGTRRLVAVEAEAFMGLGNNPDSEVTLDYHVIVPATPWRRAQLVTNANLRPSFHYEGGEGQYFDIHPGRVDRGDPSHFTFDVTWRARTVTLDGWLRDDDTVLLEPRERIELLKVSRY
jgi:hypothetical protein